MNVPLQSLRTLQAWLEACGYRRAASGRAYRSNGFSVVFDDRWITIKGTGPICRNGPEGASHKSDLSPSLAVKEADPLRDWLGTPGLWKTVHREGRRGMRREFHLPMAAVSREVDWATDLSEPAVPLEACLRWAEATARGELPAGWQSPPREQLESWIPHGGLVLQSGPLLKQGSLVRAPDRLALCFTIVNELSEDLSTARRRRLADVLRESSDRWRMVRVGLEGSADRPAVKAEIDLSGAPHPVLEDLFRAGLDALRLVVSWFLWPATFLADGRVACRAWEMPKAGFPARKRERR